MSRGRPRHTAGRGGRGARAEAPAADRIRQLVALGETPGAWDSLDADALLLIAFQLALYYGLAPESDVGESLEGAYVRLVERVTPAERLELLDRVTEAVRGSATSVAALLPFLRHEREPQVVQAAATAFASLLPLTDGDPMTGPRTVRAMLEHADEEPVRAGLLAGLLALGDRRVLPLLRGSWRRLDAEGRAALAAASLPFATACLAEFWLDWIEDADAATAEPAEHALERLAGTAGGRVLDLQRKFPENAPGDEPEIAVIGEWSVPEFGRRLAPRLDDLALRLGDPARLVRVRSAWRGGA